MTSDQSDNTNDPDELIVNTPMPFPDDTDDAELEIVPEQGETHPVFGSKIQPQEIHDQNLVGSDDGEAIRRETRTVNYDPEQDPRVQGPSAL